MTPDAPRSSPDAPAETTVAVVLAAGRGTRMDCPGKNKVCLPLAGRPVIERALSTYAACGIRTHYVVVGESADQVTRVVVAAPGRRVFCHQPEPRGTGNATGIAADALRADGYEGDVLVVAGDKVITESALLSLIDAFRAGSADMALLVGDAEDFPNAGRLVPDVDGAPVAIAEVFDIRRAQLFQALERMTRERNVPAREVRELALAAFEDEGKAAQALGPIWEMATAGQPIGRGEWNHHSPRGGTALRIHGLEMTDADLSRVRHANLSVYLFRAPALYEALAGIGSDNAQGEEYLTDTVAVLSALGRSILPVPIQSSEQVMAYNTPEEFGAIEERFARGVQSRPLAPSTTRLASEWLTCLEGDAALQSLSALYGPAGADLPGKRRLAASALNAYLGRFGDGPVQIARAPGRLNVMGRHIDHQGGIVNLIAINRDTFAVVGQRGDRTIRLHNANSGLFPDRTFSIDEVMTGFTGNWPAFVDTPAVKQRRAESAGDWSMYVEGAVARFEACARRPLAGFNAAVAGDIPAAAGLSSSSALVVAIAEALASREHTDLPPEAFVSLCAEAEWYTGTRGGAGDHAAIKLGETGRVVRFGSLPYAALGTIAFPERAVLIVCDSHEKARKTEGARDAFNQRVACYHAGREILKAAHPELAERIQHLRDLDPTTLGVSLPDLLRLLSCLPESLSRDEVRRALPEYQAEAVLATHGDTGADYPIRSVVLFGVTECARARECGRLLQNDDLRTFGRWMDISHDGDRVASWDLFGNARPYQAQDHLETWIKEAIAGEPGAALTSHSGGYGCSTPRIDRMVDIIRSMPGVLGAQISGAGLGGCLMALVQRDRAEGVMQLMETHFYEPLGLEPAMFQVAPVAGSGLLRL